MGTRGRVGGGGVAAETRERGRENRWEQEAGWERGGGGGGGSSSRDKGRGWERGRKKG